MKLGQDINSDANYVAGSATYKQGAWEAFALYRFNKSLEVGLGGLGNKIDASLNATVPPGSTPVSGSKSISWGVPLLAMRWTPWNTERWSGLLFAD